MDIEAMKRFPIEDFLARLGHHPVQRRANAVWYKSHYREEHTPSFKVNPEKNLWFDFGEGKGGNKWVYGVEYLQTNHDYRSTTIPAAQFTAEGGFYYNFLSDAKKVVFLYAGVSALAGYETVNWGEKTLYDGARLNNGDAFVYGCAATLDMEVYLADFIALTASLRERFLWGGSMGVCHTEYGIGVKFIIN